MLYTELTRKALRVAYDAHHGQTDKTGVPYIYHPIHLAEHIGDDEILIATALLHDVVEDSAVSLADIEAEGIPADVIAALKLLTHGNGVPYLDYVDAIRRSRNRAAIAVKLADLRHNSDGRRLVSLDDAARARIEKYLNAISLLESDS
jgi:(p)ppGpp synthase/HD superfamily hydrolase